MNPNSGKQQISQVVEDIYRRQSRRIFASLVRILGDLDDAEEGLAEAFRAALEQWPERGVPLNPRSWLISVGRFKAVDAIRRRKRLISLDDQQDFLDDQEPDPRLLESVPDDRLRLIFICNHPDLATDARVALTLREVCGLSTEEIAKAFLTKPSTIAQRIVRAKSKIRADRIAADLPPTPQLAGRLDAVLRVIYLVYNEGYTASSGAHLTRVDLSSEAIRLSRLVLELLPDSEAIGLLGLMLLNDSRRPARETTAGEIVLLEDQDRSLWNQGQIAEGLVLVRRAIDSRRIGPYTLQAAIAAEHARAASLEVTNWQRITALYELLLDLAPSPVVALNRAAALAMAEGPELGLALVDEILSRGELSEYHLAYSLQADLCRRLGRKDEARAAYARAIELAALGPEKRFLERRLEAL